MDKNRLLGGVVTAVIVFLLTLPELVAPGTAPFVTLST